VTLLDLADGVGVIVATSYRGWLEFPEYIEVLV
jgi:hypothetical protein